jgi:hypothetical protein
MPVDGAQIPTVWQLSKARQTTAVPTHLPAVHLSPVVHASLSLHVPVDRGLWSVKPVDGLHTSIVHGFPSSTGTTAVPTHLPVAHVSPVVHMLLSSQVPPVRFMCVTVPFAALHASAVHTLLSSVVFGVPPQTPAVQTSPVVHMLASLHVVPLAAFGVEHNPVPGAHVPTVWHVSAAWHTTDVPAAQTPAWHDSAPLHRFASAQVVPLVVFAHAPPVHKPVWPHGATTGKHIASAVPFATATHVPDVLHVWQAPPHAVPQHRPSAQNVDVQSVPVTHNAPLPSFSPQRCVWRLQMTPFTQFALVVQLVAHWVAFRHLNDPQVDVMTAPQAPVPVQVAGAVNVLTAPAVVLVLSTHACVRQPCALPRNRQRAVPAALVALLFPAQVPSNPHVIRFVVRTHAVAGSGSVAPAATAVHVPIEPAMRHDSHVPVHAELQQTPGLPCTR